jgi:hypothetical protein
VQHFLSDLLRRSMTVFPDEPHQTVERELLIPIVVRLDDPV